jgi:hypothetical protein
MLQSVDVNMPSLVSGWIKLISQTRAHLAFDQLLSTMGRPILGLVYMIVTIESHGLIYFELAPLIG